jgi:hypothetical protein
METIGYVVLGYITWCLIAFAIAWFFNIEKTSRTVTSLVLIIASAPMVLLDFVTGKSFFR